MEHEGPHRIHFDATLDEVVDANMRLTTRTPSFRASRMRRQSKRVFAELLGGSADVRCDIELRQEGVWTAQSGVEVTFPWSSAAGVEDTGDAVELRFNPGLVVARNRAFRDNAERLRFIEQARVLSNEFKVRTTAASRP